MENNIYYQTVDVVIPSSAVAGIQTDTEVTLNETYSKCIGMAFVEINNAGSTRYDLGFRNNPNEQLAQFHDRSMWIAPTSGVKLDDKFREVEFAVTGQKSYILLKTYANSSAEIRLQAIFKLQK